MKVSAAGRAFITAEEGCVLRTYRDQAGLPTCGVGHLCVGDEARLYARGMTQAQADELLEHDLAWVEKVIAKRIVRAWTPNEFDATASLVFNCGPAPLTGLVGRLLNVPPANHEELFRAWSAWCHGPAKVVLPVLVARRAREIALFMGTATAAGPT